MIALASDEWRVLRHALGTAEDLPELIAAVCGEPLLPMSSEIKGTWFDLWMRLCDQGRIGTASVAAVPHLVKAGLAAEGGVLNPNFIQLPMAIETARRMDPGELLAGPGGAAYEEAVGRLVELCRVAAAVGNAELVKVARLAERVLGMSAGG
ncbi:MAG: hypothetical protein DVB22_002550 [Verrucomicrobia bacterium]|jgi:hypothetical protein|nr:MAG: hypothetical protein DVB22_002550 [Verrucomicrobiota bacterium]